MNYSRLKGRIKEKYKTQAIFASKLGISAVSLSAKLNNAVSFSQNEINKSCELLDIPPIEISIYFFDIEVKET